MTNLDGVFSPVFSVVIMCTKEEIEAEIMVRARARGMLTGEYVFFVYHYYPDGEQPWEDYLDDNMPNATAEEIQETIDCFYHMKEVGHYFKNKNKK